MVHFYEFELTVGDVLQVGEMTVTVMDIENGEVTFRVDDGASYSEEALSESVDRNSNLLPR